MDEATLTPLPGGFAGETFLATIGGERTVVRIYGRSWARRGDSAAEIDGAVLRLVNGLIPVPEVIEVRRGNADNGLPPLLVTAFVEGQRLDEAMEKWPEKKQRAAARNVGVLLARLAQMPMTAAGSFADGSLRIVSPGASVLTEHVDLCIDRSPALRALPEAEREALRGYAAYSQGLLGDVSRRTLVHGDFHPRNLLVDQRSAEVVAVLDWESAHAGLPLADLGSVLRFSGATLGKRAPAFEEAVLRAYADLVPDAWATKSGSLDRLHEKARAADLWALVDLAGRHMSPAAEIAHALLREDVRGFRSRD